MTKVCRAVILADDSAFWKVAGLPQVERLALALDELALARDERIEIYILWSPAIPQSQRFVPRQPRLSRVEFSAAPFDSADLLLDSRILLHRNSSSLRRETESEKCEQLPQNFTQLSAVVRSTWTSSEATEGWDYLGDPSQIATSEKRFLRGSGKSQDGLISRFLNRPISRAISRLLLKTSITPSAWTLAIFALPLLARPSSPGEIT